MDNIQNSKGQNGYGGANNGLNNGVNNEKKQDDIRLRMNRPLYQLEDLNKDHLYEKPQNTACDKLKNKVRQTSVKRCIKNTLPILKWLPKYKWRNDFPKDIVSGITVAIMHIPQGMAYGLLGEVPPVIGIYMAIFPVLMYVLLGTSRHVSIGTFAIVCLMTGQVVNQHSSIDILQNGSFVAAPSAFKSRESGVNIGLDLTNVQVASTVTITVAFMQLAMYCLRFGLISSLLSETLVNGFTCAAAFHIVSSQLKDYLGLPTEKVRGNFSFFITIYNSILALPQANRYACGISVVATLALLVNNEIFKPCLAKRTHIPFPIELIAVVLGTTVSYLFQLPSNYNITVVGRIPTGLPDITVPYMPLVPHILLDSFVIAMVSFTITISMGLIFARKLLYKIDSNQELLALGVSNTVGAFFSCLPVTASLSRSMIQEQVGGVTQIASVVSCTILLVVLMWLGPLFELLPRCVLASIIIVALKGMLLQCLQMRKYWRLSSWDSAVWLITFFSTLCLQISYGLFFGIFAALLSLFIQGYSPYNCLLGVLPKTDLYVDLTRYKGAVEVSGIKIFHFTGGLNFASRTSFKELLCKKTGLNPTAILRKRAGYPEDTSDTIELLSYAVILDFSAITFVDPSGVEQIRQIQSDFKKIEIDMYLAACSGPVYEMFIRCEEYEKSDNRFIIFPTIHDAVMYAQELYAKTELKT